MHLFISLLRSNAFNKLDSNHYISRYDCWLKILEQSLRRSRYLTQKASLKAEKL